MKQKLKACMLQTKDFFVKHTENGNLPFAMSIAFTCMFVLFPEQIYASDMWTKAEDMMKNIYGEILKISTAAGVVCAMIALLLMNSSKNGRTVDESRAWLKRIVVVWVILNSLGFIVAYIKPLVEDGKWNGQ